MTWTELVVSVCGTLMTPNLDEHILDIAEYNDVEKEIVLSVVYQESRFKQMLWVLLANLG